MENINNKVTENNTINIRAEIEKYLIYWKWFLLSIIFFIAFGYVYLRYKSPVYSATGTILIKNDKQGGLSDELAAFKDIGLLGGSNKSIDNEIEVIKSRKIVSDAIKSLNLNILYLSQGRIKLTDAYNKSPVKINFIKRSESIYTLDTLFTIKVLSKDKFVMSGGTNSKEFEFGETIVNELGAFTVIKNANSKYKEITVKVVSLRTLIDAYKSKTKVEPISKRSSVLKITVRDKVKYKAEDFLNQLIFEYNKDAINDKNEVAKKTKSFIENRLEKITKDLESVDDNIKTYKLENNLTDISAESQLFLETVSENDKALFEADNQITIIESIIKNYFTKANKDDIIPNLILDNEQINLTIDAYNTLILRRKKLLETASLQNPSVKSLDSNIASLGVGLSESLKNYKSSIEITRNKLKDKKDVLNKRIKAIPSIEKKLIDIFRQQTIIAELYSYLLRKREEADITLAVTVPNAKIIDDAYSSGSPVSPSKNIIYLLCLFGGLALPIIFVYIKDLLDTKIHSKQDLQFEISVPFLGDIPKSDSKEKIIIGNDVRSSTAEAFRLIRTNLDFMLANNRKQSKSIFITSTTSGEGKSFISINIASTLALSGKKVLLIGMDLRAPKVTEYLGIPDRKGVTNYITDDTLTIDDIKFNIPQVKGLDIISSGVVPPNPAELLMTKRVENLFTIVKQEYDIVIVDTAPVNLVTDTLLIGKYADMFMYVVRANYLDKRLLAVPQELYNEKKLPNMAIVLNDTDPKRSYGYGYGGYGYGYVVVEKPWYKKIFNRG